jgi:hypothetical protein
MDELLEIGKWENTVLIFAFADEKYDYTGGHLDEMLDIIIDSGATLFVSAVGVAPQWAIDKLHKAGVL